MKNKPNNTNNKQVNCLHSDLEFCILQSDCTQMSNKNKGLTHISECRQHSDLHSCNLSSSPSATRVSSFFQNVQQTPIYKYIENPEKGFSNLSNSLLPSLGAVVQNKTGHKYTLVRIIAGKTLVWHSQCRVCNTALISPTGLKPNPDQFPSFCHYHTTTTME